MNVYIGVGGNLPTTRAVFFQLATELKNVFSAAVRFSSVYQTDPFDGSEGNAYLNMCVELVFAQTIEPSNILQKIQDLEYKLGRARTRVKWAPRVIDLDILLIDDLVIQQPNLTVPHYQLTVRDFFLIPLQELSPHTIIPPGKHPISWHLAQISDRLRTSPDKIINSAELDAC